MYIVFIHIQFEKKFIEKLAKNKKTKENYKSNPFLQSAVININYCTSICKANHSQIFIIIPASPAIQPLCKFAFPNHLQPWTDAQAFLCPSIVAPLSGEMSPR